MRYISNSIGDVKSKMRSLVLGRHPGRQRRAQPFPGAVPDGQQHRTDDEPGPGIAQGAEAFPEHAIEALADAGTYDLGAKSGRIEKPEDWTRERILAKAREMARDKGPEGDFDD